MATRHAPVSNALALADLLDATLAEDWIDDTLTLAVLSWRGPGDDDLDLAMKAIDGHPAEELKVFGPDHECLAVGLSRLEEPGSAGFRLTGAYPVVDLWEAVRVTVTFDEFDEVTLVRHPDGQIERPAVTDGSTADLLRESLSEVRFRT
ncbi:MAG TPA: hypothetical protein VGL92_04400 [Acidimicrobiia bacterium]|jgi:hypothetical protein